MASPTPPPFPPGPKGLWFLGSALEQLRDPLGILVRGRERYGDIVRFNMGPGGTLILVNHPDYVKHVLVTNAPNYEKTLESGGLQGNGLFTSKGDVWKRQRRMVQPGFHRDQLGSMVQSSVDGTQGFAARMEAYARSGKPFDAEQEMMWVLRSILCQNVFSVDLTEQSPTLREDLDFVMAFSRRKVSLWNVLPLPRLGQRRYRASARRIIAAVYEQIRQRVRTPGARRDQLAMMMAARDLQGEPMAEKQLKDEAITLVVAGHEATVSALTWVWYLLDQHPDVQGKVRQELTTVLGDAPPTVERLAQLPYSRGVFHEAMRLYSPAWIMGRRAKQEDQIGGYTIPANAIVIFSQYVMHRHPAYWEDPERFDPERFTPERKAPTRYTYFPFGAGQRMCVGENLADIHALIIMSTVLQRYRLQVVPGFPVEPEAGITLRPARGLRVIAHPMARETPRRLATGV